MTEIAINLLFIGLIIVLSFKATKWALKETAVLPFLLRFSCLVVGAFVLNFCLWGGSVSSESNQYSWEGASSFLAKKMTPKLDK